MNFDKYKNTKRHPRKNEFQTTYWYKQGRCVYIQKFGEPIQVIGDADFSIEYVNCVKEVVLDEAAYRAASKAYNSEDSILLEQFKTDLMNELGWMNHPLAEKLYNKAWEMSHSSGLEEVYTRAMDLADLVECPSALSNAILVMNRFEYDSAGLIKRYPDEAEYNNAMKVLKGLL